MSETPASIQTFTVGDAEFRCFIADAGARFVWRAVAADHVTPLEGVHAMAVGRIGAKCWARSSGEVVGTDYETIRDAMIAATAARKAVAA